MTAAHFPYWNDVLQEDYCHTDGEPWPCLHHRQTRPAKCRCSHIKHAGQCYSAACGCREYRPDDIPAAMARHPAGKAIDRPSYPRPDGGPSYREYLESKGRL